MERLGEEKGRTFPVGSTSQEKEAKAKESCILHISCFLNLFENVCPIELF